MATAKNVGIKAGKAAGAVGGFLWNSTCRLAAATGDFGEGVMEGAEEGWEVSMAKEAVRKDAALVKAKALVAERMAAKAQAAATMVATAA